MARINWTRTLTTTAAAALAATAIGVGSMSQASAGGACSYAGSMCVYSDINYHGAAFNNGRQPVWYAATLNDKISSIENHSGTQICYFENSNFGGSYFSLGNNSAAPNLGNMNDRISSYGPCDQTLSYRSSD